MLNKNQRNQRRQYRVGFTLIELLVVISIIGLLASVVLVSLNSARAKARYTQALGDMKQLATAAELYHSAGNDYPPNVNPDIDPGFAPAYINRWPKPPCNGWTYDWDNWPYIANRDPTEHIIRITLRRTDSSAVYFFCVFATGDCMGSDAAGGIAIQNGPNQLSCS
jgi:prepilin-type N-terminal cleavage/methylation domain-containing protein